MISLFFFFFLMIPPPPRSTLFPYTTLFRSLSSDRFPASKEDALRTAHATAEYDDNKRARGPAHRLDGGRRKFFFVSHRQFAVAARRLRSGEASIHFLPNDQGRPVASSTDSARTRSNQTAVRRMGFSWSFYTNAIMGRSVAVPVVSRCGCLGVALISRC